jgi:two-component system sensor histidine kinase TctE
LQVSATDGRPIAGDLVLPRPGLYDFPAPGRIRLRTSLDNGVEWRIAYTWTSTPGDDENELLLIQVADTFDNRDQLASKIIRGVLFPQFMILPLALLLVWFGLSRGLAPIKVLQGKIEVRRPDDLSPIDPKEAPEELAPLVRAFNDLLARQAHTLQAQRRFIADAAHQLKTPLAGLRTQSELAMREADAAELRRTLEQIASSAERSAHTVSQLLALARTENLRDAVTLDELDIAPLVRAVIADHYGVALTKSIDLGFESDDRPSPIAGHPILLREMIGNLIDNAIRYTPEGGVVTVRVQSTSIEVVLQIEDDGIGIAPDDRQFVFERFFRVLGAGADGSGLGLSIVREIVGQHGAVIDVSDGLMWPAGRGAGTGSRFTVRFPKFNDEGL